MAKKGVLRITGNTSPKTGVKTFYKVTEWYPDTPLSERKESLVTWELFRKRADGKFTTTTIKKQGINHFTFGKDAWKYTFRVEGYLHGPEGKEPMSIIVKPQKNEQQAPPKEKEILGIKLTYHDGTPVNKKLSYKDRLWATAKCQGMEGEYITFSLWEDDEIGEGHNKKNQFILKSSPVQVDSKGYARWNFALLNTYISIANKREDDKKKHEYYVIAEYKGKLKASDNASVDNPEYKAPTPPPKKPTGSNNSEKPQSKLKPAPPKPKPDSPKGSTRSNSPNNQPDKKGEITQIKLTDINGKDFTKNPKFGETIKVSIKSKNLVGKKCTLKIWEHDLIGDDLLYSHDHTFSSDNLDVLIPLTDKMQKTGEIGNDAKNPDKGEYWQGGQQEIFAEVIILNISSKSKIIDVDIMEAPKKQDDGITATKKENTQQNKDQVLCVCKDEYKLIWGNRLTCSQRKKVVEVCKNIWGEKNKIDKANELMAIMHLESVGTFSPSKKGVTKNGTKFIGLIQFSDATARTLQTTYDALGKMTFIEQMDYVEKYLKANKDKMNTIVDFYLQVIKPNAVGNGSNSNYIVFDESISVPDGDGSKTSQEQRLKNIQKEPWVTKYGYSSNPTFMLEKDEKVKRKRWAYTRQAYEERYGEIGGKTYIWEIEKVVKGEHFKPGESERYIGNCEDKPEEKKTSIGKRAPWMEIVLEEAKNYGGYKEGKDPLVTRIKSEYFSIPNEYTTSKTDPTSVSWCAAFASWCLAKAGYANPSTCRALEFNPSYLHDGASKPDRPSHMRRISKPVYGCIIVWKNISGGGGHVAFHYGYESNGNIVPIGGNQGSSLQFSSRSPSGDYEQKIVGYFLPEDYEDNKEDEFKPEELKLDPKALNKSNLLKKSSNEISGKTT